MQKLSDLVINKFDQKEYVISTVEWKKTISIKIQVAFEEFFNDITTSFQSAIFLKTGQPIPSFATKPVLVINLINTIAMNIDDFNKLICDIVANEKINELNIPETYLKYNYLVYEKDIFSIFSVSKIRHVFIIKSIGE